MKKLLFVTILLALASAFPVTARAAVDISIGISLPPLIAFSGPPDVIVLPDTNDVYVVPDIDEDLYFWDGWWWRLWEGRWYRSRYHDRDWSYYDDVPDFYFDVEPGWRGYYRDHNWYGYHWNYERIPNRRLQRNWQSWHNDGLWERQRNWGIRNYQPRPTQQRQELRQQRQEQFQHRPEVQRYQHQRQEPPERVQPLPRQEERPPATRRKQEPPERVQPPPRQEQRPPALQPRQEPPERVQQPPRQEQRPPMPHREQETPEIVQQPQQQERRGERAQPRDQQRPEERKGDSEHRR